MLPKDKSKLIAGRLIRSSKLPMKHALLTVCMAFVLSGCNDGDGEKTATASPGNYPDWAGDWSGVYYRTDSSAREAITAQIKQDDDAIFINTSRPADASARRFTGSVTIEGEMTLTDAKDGETWTTYYGPATENKIVVADFVYPPVAGDTNRPPLYVVNLQR